MKKVIVIFLSVLLFIPTFAFSSSFENLVTYKCSYSIERISRHSPGRSYETGEALPSSTQKTQEFEFITVKKNQDLDDVKTMFINMKRAKIGVADSTPNSLIIVSVDNGYYYTSAKITDLDCFVD